MFLLCISEQYQDDPEGLIATIDRISQEESEEENALDVEESDSSDEEQDVSATTVPLFVGIH